MKKTSTAKNIYRCPVCRRLLMKGKLIYIEVKCPKCAKIVRFKD